MTRYKSYSREDIHNIHSPNSIFVRGAGKWGLHGIVSIPNKERDFIFFVTFGTIEAGHIFNEGITEDGVLTWQSKPGQKLKDPQINKFINHDHNKNNIYLLLRTNAKLDYTYIGKLAYISHNPEKEKPVQFQWQILDWKIEESLFDRIGLNLDDLEKNADPYTPDFDFQYKNQMVMSDRLPYLRKKRDRIKPGSKIVKVDFAKKNKSARENGRNGELLVVEFEKKKLANLGSSKRVKHVALEGDGHGYDIESYNEKGENIYIEVKTTVGGVNTSFDVSSNEVLVSEEKNKQYYIYRLFNYNKEMNSAEVYIINGPISENFVLETTQFIATFKGKNND
jgi:hypothetical protein